MAKVKKATPYKDGKRRKMKMTKLTAVALTARGANPGANVTFFKSEKGSESTIEKRMALVSQEVLHTHSVTIDDYVKLNGGGEVSYNNGHDHPFVIEEDGTITIGAADGHTHIMEKTFEEIVKHGLTEDELTATYGGLVKYSEEKPTADNGGINPVHKEESNMPDIKKADHEAALNNVASLTKSLAIAVLLGSMNDAQKSHHGSLDATAQEVFLAKSSAERNVELEAIAKADEVVYTATDGTEFRKSDDARLIGMAKRADVQETALAKSQAETADLAVEKRITTDFINLPGDIEHQKALVKAVDSIEDKDIRKGAQEILKAHNANLAVVTSVLGTAVVNKDIGDAGAELDALAKAHAAKENIDYFEAYDIVSLANPVLLSKAVG